MSDDFVILHIFPSETEANIAQVDVGRRRNFLCRIQGRCRRNASSLAIHPRSRAKSKIFRDPGSSVPPRGIRQLERGSIGNRI